MVLKHWMQDPGSSWGRDPRLLSSERDRVPCVALGEGQGPLCVHGGGGRVPWVALGEGAGPPVSVEEEAGSPVCPWGGGQGPLGGPGGVHLESRPHFLSLYSLSRGGPQGSLAPPARLSHSARPSPAPAPALRLAVCLAGRLSGRPSVWQACGREKLLCVF